MVKIGVLDREEPCSQENFQEVIVKLRDFLLEELPANEAEDLLLDAQKNPA